MGRPGGAEELEGVRLAAVVSAAPSAAGGVRTHATRVEGRAREASRAGREEAAGSRRRSDPGQRCPEARSSGLYTLMKRSNAADIFHGFGGKSVAGRGVYNLEDFWFPRNVFSDNLGLSAARTLLHHPTPPRNPTFAGSSNRQHAILENCFAKQHEILFRGVTAPRIIRRGVRERRMTPPRPI